MKISKRGLKVLGELAIYAGKLEMAINDTKKLIYENNCLADTTFDCALLLCDRISISLELMEKLSGK